MTKSDTIRVKLALAQLIMANKTLALLDLPAKSPGGVEATDAAAYGKFHARIASDYLRASVRKTQETEPMPEES